MAKGSDGGTGSEHLSDDLLRSLAQRELSLETAAGPLRHLAGCAVCRRRLADISPQAAELVEELWGSPENAGWMAEPSKPEVLTAAAQALPLIGPGTRVITLQNGVDSPERLASTHGTPHPQTENTNSNRRKDGARRRCEMCMQSAIDSPLSRSRRARSAPSP